MSFTSRPRTRRLTVIAQDPSIRTGRKILTTEVDVPAEEFAPGPRGYRVRVVDYDTSTGTLYQPLQYEPLRDGVYLDPFQEVAAQEDNTALLSDPQFHQQNVYAIVMRTLARFEFALGRRVGWDFPGHQLNVAPHAFAEANAFYSEHDQALVFGYFRGVDGQIIFSCLSHDVIAHETTHALLDGLRARYTDPSSPEQAGFHEGFSDVVALLSVFSLKDVVARLLSPHHAKTASKSAPDLIDPDELTREKLRGSVLMGLAEQMGREMAGVRGDRADALRRSVKLAPLDPKDLTRKYADAPEFQEPHRRGEILVAAMLNSFLDVWVARIERMQRGRIKKDGLLDLHSVVEEGSDSAAQLLTMSIRALDYAPPTDLQFCDYLSALLTADKELIPDDTKYGYRTILKENFARYGLRPPNSAAADGTWRVFDGDLTYDRSHYESMLRDPDEVFRFIWENREELDLDERAYTKVISVRPCMRVGPDGFTLRETVAEYIQMLTLRAQELQQYDPPINIPAGMSEDLEVTLYGGGALVFDEYGRLKYHVNNRISNVGRQNPRLDYLWRYGYFDNKAETEHVFARMHLQRALNLPSTSAEEF